MTTHTSPPRPQLAFRVGVVGHRPNRLGNANLKVLEETLRSILATIRGEVVRLHDEEENFFSAERPILRAISPLAEGTDRIFAKQALAQDYELCCVLPFHQQEYERDFVSPNALVSNSLQDFGKLLGQAITTFEMDGDPECRDKAYGACGTVVINQSDLLVVVWDGERVGLRGGTEETFDEAQARGIPVVWVDAHAPHEWQLVDPAYNTKSSNERHVPNPADNQKNLQVGVRESLEVPRQRPSRNDENNGETCEEDDASCQLRRFFGEKQILWSVAMVWKVFRDMVADTRFGMPTVWRKPYEEAVELEWPRKPSTPVGYLIDFLRPFYAWSDKSSALYGDRYRSAFISAFLMAALAVGMALVPIVMHLEAHHPLEAVFIGLELALILGILFLIWKGRRDQWHERWIDYRLAAELIRHLKFVAPLGGVRLFPQVPAHRAIYGQPGSTWMAWYVRAIERTMGLPSVAVDKQYLMNCVDRLQKLLYGQRQYHDKNQQRCHSIETRTHKMGVSLLVLTLIACSVHFAPVFWHQLAEAMPDWLPHWLTFCCGFFPALGAALAGINNQGEFRRTAKRSKSMCNALEGLIEQLTELEKDIEATSPTTNCLASVRTRDFTSYAVKVLVVEVLDWRALFLDQPLKEPA